MTTLKEFPEKYVLLSTIKCLEVIMGNKDEWEVPEETSQKIVIANEIIMHCKVSASSNILRDPLLTNIEYIFNH